MDRKIKHLEFIQGVINHLASDSFRMKGWCVVLVAALFVLLAREGRIEFVGVALVCRPGSTNRSSRYALARIDCVSRVPSGERFCIELARHDTSEVVPLFRTTG